MKSWTGCSRTFGKEGAHVFYVKSEVEFGVIGEPDA